MGDLFRRMVDEELSGEQPPSVAGLVDRAVRDGRRLRRLQTLRTGAAGGVAVVAVATALTVGIGVAGNGPRDGASVSASPVAPARATPAALLQLLTSLLPPGRTAGFAGHSDSSQVVAQLTLDTGHGPGTIRVTVARTRRLHASLPDPHPALRSGSRRCCWPTSPPATSIPAPAPVCSRCCGS